MLSNSVLEMKENVRMRMLYHHIVDVVVVVLNCVVLCPLNPVVGVGQGSVNSGRGLDT